MAKNFEVDRTLDLSGEVCPYTFVNSKLELEDMEAGQVLEVIVDNAESASNVPRSLQGEGNVILALEKEGKKSYHIFCQKK